MSHRIAVLIGSLRAASWNRKVAHAMIELAPAGMRFDFVEIGGLPLYNEDLEAEGKTPAAWTAFRDEIRDVDGVMFFTPEYNRTVPGCLKNAIDVGSRPYGKSVWLGKPAAVISVSPGALGAFGANMSVRQSCVCLDMPVMHHPEAYVSFAAKLFDEQGKLVSEDTRKFFTLVITRYADWVGKVRS